MRGDIFKTIVTCARFARLVVVVDYRKRLGLSLEVSAQHTSRIPKLLETRTTVLKKVLQTAPWRR